MKPGHFASCICAILAAPPAGVAQDLPGKHSLRQEPVIFRADFPLTKDAALFRELAEFLVHGYLDVDLDTVWNILKADLIRLQDFLKAIAKTLGLPVPRKAHIAIETRCPRFVSGGLSRCGAK